MPSQAKTGQPYPEIPHFQLHHSKSSIPKPIVQSFPSMIGNYERIMNINQPMLLNLNENDMGKFVYRIIPMDRLKELFNMKRNALVRPILWSDPWENIVFKSTVEINGVQGTFGDIDNCYGQCWTYHTASDAMWQIYSRDGKGVRIKIQIENLVKMFKDQIGKWTNAQCAIGKVEYLRQKKFNEYLASPFPSGLNQESYFETLLKKRTTFIHERELRILFFSEDKNDQKRWFSGNRNLFHLDFDPAQMIEQIMLHPATAIDKVNTTKEEVSAATGFPIDKIIASKFYRPPEKITISL